MKRRYPSQVMEYRKIIMNETGIELSPEEAERDWIRLCTLPTKAGTLHDTPANPLSMGTCIICGKGGVKLRHKCCSLLCFLERVHRNPEAADGVEDGA